MLAPAPTRSVATPPAMAAAGAAEAFGETEADRPVAGGPPAARPAHVEEQAEPPAAIAEQPERALYRAWYERLRPADAAELATVDALVAGVRRRRRIDGLEERILAALAEGCLDSLPALAALARCRARIERDRRLLLEELDLLREPVLPPLRRAAARRSPSRPAVRSRHPAPAAGQTEGGGAVPGLPPRAAAVSPGAPTADRSALRQASGTADGRRRPPAVPPRHAAPEAGRGAVRLLPVVEAVRADPLAAALAAALPSRRRDFARLPDWRARASALALQVGRMAASLAHPIEGDRAAAI